MTHSPTVLDHLLCVVMVLVGPLLDRFWFYPRLLRTTAAGIPGARNRAYGIIIATTVAPTAAVLALWLAGGRPWTAMRLGADVPWRMAAGLALCVAYTVLAVLQYRTIVAKPQRLIRVRRALEHAQGIIPRTASELRVFTGVCLSAGLCEEFLFRGYLTWYLATWLGPVAAVFVSAVCFGFGHFYQGARYAVRTGVVGLALAGVVALSGSLIPAMILHTCIDLLGGAIGYRAYTADDTEPTPA